MKSLSVHELKLVDANGTTKIRLTGDTAHPAIEMLGPNGKIAASIALDASGLASVTLKNSNGPSASLAVDSKGTHVKFDHPSGASSYLFLNNQGVSGIVLVDKDARRRYEVLLNADGTTTIGTPDDAGKHTP